jgi:hypothetical protein
MQVMAACRRPFIPQSKLDMLLSKDKVVQMVEEISNMGHLPSDLYREQHDRHQMFTIIRDPRQIDIIYQDYKKILALLVMVEQELCIVNFWQQGEKNDRNLPLDKDWLEKLDPELSKTSFFNKQQLFLAPEFTDTLKTQTRHWGPEVVLPFLENERLVEGKGGFAHVFKIKIHPDYDKLGSRRKGRKKVRWL